MKKKVDIHFEPMACSTMVINKEGYFEDHIKTVNRKTIAVEMESYGVARACQFGNEGKTKWIIFKSVMDNTKQKTDEAKKFAAHTSALFMKEILYRGILDG
jgi:nucleoside phosphorylase